MLIQAAAGFLAESSYPLRVEENEVTVIICRYRPTSGYVSCAVTHPIEGKRQRTTFVELRRAKKHAKTTAKQLAAGEAAALQLRNRDGIIYVRALERLRPVGIELDKAAADYAGAWSPIRMTSGSKPEPDEP